MSQFLILRDIMDKNAADTAAIAVDTAAIAVAM